MEAKTGLGILRGPVHAAGGLGLGLYRVASHAEACGLSLAIEHNTDGRVCFVLSGPLDPAMGPATA